MRRISLRAAMAVIALGLLLPGCGSTGENVALVAGITALGAHTPANEIEQIYYLGVFDPQDQLPPMVYRVTVRGQASLISSTKFATGWLPADFVDSLNTDFSFQFDGSGQGPLTLRQGTQQLAKLKPGRKLTVFGPEGFREVPDDYRLVMVMGTDPSAFFNAVGEALGSIAEQEQRLRQAGSKAGLAEALAAVREELIRMEALEQRAARELRQSGGDT